MNNQTSIIVKWAKKWIIASIVIMGIYIGNLSKHPIIAWYGLVGVLLGLAVMNLVFSLFMERNKRMKVENEVKEEEQKKKDLKVLEDYLERNYKDKPDLYGQIKLVMDTRAGQETEAANRELHAELLKIAYLFLNTPSWRVVNKIIFASHDIYYTLISDFGVQNDIEVRQMVLEFDYYKHANNIYQCKNILKELQKAHPNSPLVIKAAESL